MRPVEQEDLLGFKTIDDVQLSPEGTRIVFTFTAFDVEEDSYHSSIWMVGLDTAPFQFTRGPKDVFPRWSPDGRHVAFNSERSGAPELFLISTLGGEAFRLTSQQRGAGASVWSPDGTQLLYSARVPNDQAPITNSAFRPRVITRAHYKDDGAGYVLDATSHLFVTTLDGATEQLTFDEGDDRNPTWSPDGRFIAFSRPCTGGTDYEVTDIWVMRCDGSGAQRLTQTLHRAVSPTWSPRGEATACYAADGPLETWGDPNARVWLVPLNGAPPRPLAPDYDRAVNLGSLNALTLGPQWSADAASVSVAISDAGNIHLVRMRLDGTVTPLVTGARQILSASFSPSSHRIAFCAADNGNPCDIFVCGEDGTHESRLTQINESLLQELALPVVETRKFSSPHGGTVDGWVLAPASISGQGPLLLDIHGGPHGFVGNAFSLYYFYRYVFALRGWTVLLINPSGSGSYGKKFSDRIRGHWGEADMPEHMAAINTLVAVGAVDATRPAVTGASYGGYMSAWMISQTDRFCAAAIGAPISNLESMYGTSDFGPWFQAWQLRGDLNSPRETYRRLSPINYVDRIKTPTLILHGEADERCPIGQGEELFSGLMAAGKAPTAFVRYPGSSHRFLVNGRPSHRVDYARRIWEWIEHYTR